MSDENHDNRPGKGNGHAEEAAAGETAVPDKGVALVEEPPPTREAHEALRRENADLREQILRRRADFENYKKRMERERATAGLDALAALVKDLVPSLDNFERALEAPSDDAAALRDGVALIQRGLLATLESHGLHVEDPAGARFDPQNHQALSYDDAPGHAEGSISRVFGKGYFLKDRLLRPALVQVARGTPAAEGPAAAPDESNSAGAPQEGGAEAAAPEGNTSGTDALH